ncbi:hypothetical protein [Verminephrobacter eiseniae]|uniref:hypothetical protein n=1 Tax=Verminephrobacter eiseniae TaxID=364317 RepID=UPI002237C69C|nr:hypothetical protein [Verminephrobacter eiseniae]
MSYPLSDSFAFEPATGHTAVLGGMSATHNSVQQSIDISAPNSQSILRFNETAHGDFWFDADVELLTDPSASKHIGLWMTTGNGSEGYRFAHLDGAWSVTRWNSGFGDGAAVSGGINEGAKPVAGVADVAPTLNVGQRLILRCEVIVGAFDANGVPWARLIQFKAGGVLMFQIGDAAYCGKLIPGVFLYGATARIHAIAGDVPSGLPAFPPTVSVNAADDLLPLAAGRRSTCRVSTARRAICGTEVVATTGNSTRFRMAARTSTSAVTASSLGRSRKRGNPTNRWCGGCSSSARTSASWSPRRGLTPAATTDSSCWTRRSDTPWLATTPFKTVCRCTAP